MKKNKVERDITEEIDQLENMPPIIVDLLIEKSIMTGEECCKEHKKRVKIK